MHPSDSSREEKATQGIVFSNTMAQGIVFKKSQGHYAVHAQNKLVDCSLSNKLRKQLLYPIAAPTSISPHVVAVRDIREVDPVAIGDVVEFVDAGAGCGVITQVLPRKNKLARVAAGFKPIEQVIVANIDQIVIVCAVAQPKPDWGLLDRYLAGSEAANIPAVICFTKTDLIDEKEFARVAQIYQEIGYPVMLTSTANDCGIDEFKNALRGRVSVLLGQSGVGKTSLLNTIQPGLGLRVKEVSRYWNKGKHTTSYLEMFPLDIGGGVVDTPGMREFSLWQINDAELDYLFREMRPYLGRCKFRADCTHSHEPGCAIRAAVDAGAISERRYKNYLGMKE
jgi:ribosome biogenesis GTPase